MHTIDNISKISNIFTSSRPVHAAQMNNDMIMNNNNNNIHNEQ